MLCASVNHEQAVLDRGATVQQRVDICCRVFGQPVIHAWSNRFGHSEYRRNIATQVDQHCSGTLGNFCKCACDSHQGGAIATFARMEQIHHSLLVGSAVMCECRW
jgi:hypothetical protein